MRKVKSPIEIYDADKNMPEFVLEVIEELLAKHRRKKAFLKISIEASKIEKCLKERAKKEGVEYSKKWLSLFPLYCTGEWEVDVKKWDDKSVLYSFTPINVTYNDYSTLHRDDDFYEDN